MAKVKEMKRGVVDKLTTEMAKAKEMKKEVVAKLSILATAAFGLVAALAWNSAIQSWFKNQPLLSKGGPWVYAIVVTIIAVLVTIWISKVSEKMK